MRNRRLIIGVVILGLIALPVIWWLASPLFISRTVDEAFPFDLPADGEIADLSPDEADKVMKEVMPLVDEEFVDGLPAEQAGDLEDRLMKVAEKMPDHPMDETMPLAEAEWELVLQGGVRDADSFHQGSGTASIFQQAGQRVLRFENFEVTNGPDLHVLLVENVDGTGRDSMGAYVDLGSLKGNMGNQNYDIPADVNLDLYEGVMIYCVPFHVVFATAPFGN